MNNLPEKLINECQNLEKTIVKAEETMLLINRLDNAIYFEPLVSALTLYLENFYMRVERIFSLIAKDIDKTMPLGENWHIQLLKQMSMEITSVRAAVISPETYKNLNEFRGFRHVARNLYAHDLNPQRVIDLSSRLSPCHENLNADLKVFLDKLSIN